MSLFNLCLILFNKELGYERQVGYIEFGNKHKVPNPVVDCKNPSEEDDEQNLVDQSEKHVSCKNYLYGSVNL